MPKALQVKIETYTPEAIGFTRHPIRGWMDQDGRAAWVAVEELLPGIQDRLATETEDGIARLVCVAGLLRDVAMRAGPEERTQTYRVLGSVTELQKQYPLPTKKNRPTCVVRAWKD